MKKILLGLSVVSLVTFLGCSNVRFVETREGCRRGVLFFAWDVCEDVDNPEATPRLKIKGDTDIGNIEQPSQVEEPEGFKEPDELREI